MKSHRVLIFSSDRQGIVSAALQQILEPHFSLLVQHHSEADNSGKGSSFWALLQRCLQQVNPDLAFLVLPSGHLTEMKEFLASVAKLNVPVIVVTETCAAQEMFELLEAGTADFIILPLEDANILPRAWRLLKRNKTTQESTPAPAREGLSQLIGKNPSFVAQVEKIQTIADCEANVLITGETGTGKELYARGIHYCSARAGRPFMPVNCGAIPIELVENELFGHERGAFTSAASLQTGLIAEANGGTLFLDEIDCLPTMAQVKLLRFLQDKEYRPLGSARTRQANVRIIAASNLDLAEAVGNGRVRQDLFYRLNVISLALPPLRERPEDIPLLASHFLDKYLTQFNRRTIALSPEALNALMVYRWPVPRSRYD